MQKEKIEEFKKSHKELMDTIKNLSQEERDALYWATRDYEDKIKPRFSCKRGDVLKFWSEWTDFSKGIFIPRMERIAIALSDGNNTDDLLCLEYLGNEHGCWRSEPVRGDKFIEIIGHIDLNEWEARADKMWEVIDK